MGQSLTQAVRQPSSEVEAIVSKADVLTRPLTPISEWAGSAGHPAEHVWHGAPGGVMDWVIERNFRINQIALRSNVSGESMFFSGDVAQSVLDTGVNVQGRSKVEAWVRSADPNPLGLTYTGSPGVAIGRGINVGDAAVGDRTNAVILLVKDDSLPRGFYVKTAYPIN